MDYWLICSWLVYCVLRPLWAHTRASMPDQHRWIDEAFFVCNVLHTVYTSIGKYTLTAHQHEMIRQKDKKGPDTDVTSLICNITSHLIICMYCICLMMNDKPYFWLSSNYHHSVLRFWNWNKYNITICWFIKWYPDHSEAFTQIWYLLSK